MCGSMQFKHRLYQWYKATIGQITIVCTTAEQRNTKRVPCAMVFDWHAKAPESLPAYLRSLLQDDTDKSKQFSKLICKYNMAFQITSLGAHYWSK